MPQSSSCSRRSNMWKFITLAALIGSIAGQVQFGDEATTKSSADSVVVDAQPAAAAPAEGEEVNTRFLPLVNGIIGNLVGTIKNTDSCLSHCGVGNPQLSSQCCGLGFTQCCGFSGGLHAGLNPGFNNGFGGGFNNGFGGGAKPGVCPRVGFNGNAINGFPGNPGFNPGFNPGLNPGFQGGFGSSLRSADGASTTTNTRRRRQESSVKFEGETETATEGKTEEVNPRFLGLFNGGLGGVGAEVFCSSDFQCPGQLKCCSNGFRLVCQQPAFFG